MGELGVTQEGVEICIIIADLCCMAETDTTLYVECM